MKDRLTTELDLDAIFQLVAAHAKTSVGRDLLFGSEVLPGADESERAVGLSTEISELLVNSGTVAFSGVDDALPFLHTGAPAPRDLADLMALLELARRVGAVRRQLAEAPVHLRQIASMAAELPDTDELVRSVTRLLGRDGRIADDATPELARLRRQALRLRQSLLEGLEQVRRSHPGVVSDAPPTLRRDRYCLPVRAGAQAQLPGLVLDSSGTGATVFLEPFAMVALNNELADAQAREREEIDRILAEVAAAFAASMNELRAAVELFARLDAAQAKVLFGRRVEGRLVAPGETGESLVLRGARHPLLDERLHVLRVEVLGFDAERDAGRRAVPLDLRLPEGVATLVISGPNAGGKTVVLKTVGVLAVLAAHGIPVPAEAGTSIPRLDRLWCHIGDEQSVRDDLSTFSAAMAATAELLSVAGPGALVLYDELGAGTDPLEGAALGCAVLEELTRRGCLAIATTHLASIAMTATAAEGMGNAAMEYDEARDRPTYRLRVGRPGRSRGLEIARAMGVATSVLERAHDLLGGDHLALDRWLQRLEALEGELLIERGEMDEERRRLTAAREATEAEAARLEDARRRLPEELRSERDRLRQRAKTRLDEAIATLEAATRDQTPIGRRRLQQLREVALDLPLTAEADDGETPVGVADGARVAVAGLKGEGVVTDRRGQQVQVALAGKKLWVGEDRLRLLEPSSAPRPPRVSAEVGEAGPSELMLIGLDAEAARDELEHFLDHALATGAARVRVVHGHGAGVLRRMVGEVCRSHPAVRSFAAAPPRRGGTGATEIAIASGD